MLCCGVSSVEARINLDYGQCFHCNRIMPIKRLVQIRFYEGHLIKGKFHHKLLCQACKKAANQIFEDVEDAHS